LKKPIGIGRVDLDAKPQKGKVPVGAESAVHSVIDKSDPKPYRTKTWRGKVVA
jgi:hypothetical protein